MKDNIKVIIYVLIFALFMVFAIIGYKKLLVKENTKINNEINDVSSNTQSSKTKLEDFEVYSEDGTKVKVSSFKGKPIIINVWTSWCTYCNIEMPYFNELYLKEKDNIKFMMINITGDRDTKEAAKKFVTENNYDFDVYYDLNLDAARALGIYSYPTTIFIDKEGYIDSTKIGVITKEELENKIEELK